MAGSSFIQLKYPCERALWDSLWSKLSLACIFLGLMDAQNSTAAGIAYISEVGVANLEGWMIGLGTNAARIAGSCNALNKCALMHSWQ